jgi:hypothetical protein
MAKYLVNIDLNNNQLQNAALHPVGTAPSSPVEGQVYFDTSPGDKEMYFWNGTAWIAMGSQGDITEIQSSTTNQLTVTNGTGPIPSLAIVTGAVTNGGTALATGDQIYDFVTGLGYVESVGVNNSTFINLVDSGTAAAPDLTASLSATGTPDSTKYLRGDNTWSAISGIYSWTVAGDTGSETIINADTVTFAGGTNVTTAYDTGTNTLTINSTDQYVGTVTSVGTGNSTFISGSGGPITTSGSLTYSLSATGTPSSSTYLRGDNTWATLPADTDNYVDSISFSTATGILTLGRTGALADLTQSLDGRYLIGNQTITLSGEVTGSGTTSISTTVANNVLDINNFTAATIVTEAEGIANNDNDTTLPTSAAVKDYVDNAIVGGLVYQGGYNAATNTPDLDSSPSASIKKGWTYTVTADGSFFTEQVRVGDVLIAEVDAPTALADWTTVQNNIDLASASQVGIGNVAAGTGISVSYSSGTATVTNTDTNSANTATGTITAGNTSGTVTHSFGINTIVQTIDSSGNTVYCDIARTTTSVTASISAAQSGNITILVQKIG